MADRLRNILTRKWVIDHAPLALLSHAYELVVAVVLGVLAVPILFGSVEPASIHAALPLWMARVWAWGLFVSAVLTVVGLYRPRQPRIEWVGQILMGTTLSLYSLAIFAEVGMTRGGLPGAVFGVLGALGGWRAFKVTCRDLIQDRLTREATNAIRRMNRRVE